MGTSNGCDSIETTSSILQRKQALRPIYRRAIAGDLLPNPTLKQLVAASYNRLNQISREGGIQDKEYVKKYQLSAFAPRQLIGLARRWPARVP